MRNPELGKTNPPAIADVSRCCTDRKTTAKSQPEVEINCILLSLSAGESYMGPSGPFGSGHFRGPGGLSGEARLCAITVEACRPTVQSEDGTAARPFESLSTLRGPAGPRHLNVNPDQPEEGIERSVCMWPWARFVCVEVGADKDTGLSPVLIGVVLCVYLCLQSTCPALLQPGPGIRTSSSHVWQTGRRRPLCLKVLRI